LEIEFIQELKNFRGKLKNGFAISLKYINLFTIINNIELKPYKGSSLSRAAGASSLLIGKKKKKVLY